MAKSAINLIEKYGIGLKIVHQSVLLNYIRNIFITIAIIIKIIITVN